jgi:hypothetical protein
MLMDNDAKKTALRMIPYGLYVLTAEDGEGSVAAATVNWVTQTAFEPPLVAVGVKVDSGSHALIKSTGAFALNVLGKGQQGQAYAFFKPVERDGDTLGGEPCRTGTTGAPILDNAPAFVECKLEGRPLALRRRSRQCGRGKAARRPRRRRNVVAEGLGGKGLLRGLSPFWIGRQSQQWLMPERGNGPRVAVFWL